MAEKTLGDVMRALQSIPAKPFDHPVRLMTQSDPRWAARCMRKPGQRNGGENADQTCGSGDNWQANGCSIMCWTMILNWWIEEIGSKERQHLSYGKAPLPNTGYQNPQDLCKRLFSEEPFVPSIQLDTTNGKRGPWVIDHRSVWAQLSEIKFDTKSFKLKRISVDSLSDDDGKRDAMIQGLRRGPIAVEGKVPAHIVVVDNLTTVDDHLQVSVADPGPVLHRYQTDSTYLEKNSNDRFEVDPSRNYKFMSRDKKKVLGENTWYGQMRTIFIWYFE